MLFFWGTGKAPIAIAIDVPCPAQTLVSREGVVNADFWQPVRESLRQRFGDDVVVLGWIGAAGDQCPAPPFSMYSGRAELRMLKLRKLNSPQELARRIVREVDDVYEVVKNDRHADVPLIHKVETVRLPMRLVTESEYADAKTHYQKIASTIAKDPKTVDKTVNSSRLAMKWYEAAVHRYENQKVNPKPMCEMELHVLRIGDAVVCTNPFELFTDYGIQIKGRSPAIQTIVVQLSGSLHFDPPVFYSGSIYLPTEKATRGGSYSAEVESVPVGFQGGQVLVDETVDAINSIWAK